MKIPSDEDLTRSIEALRTKARIWVDRGGRDPAQSFLHTADYLAYGMKGRRMGKKKKKK